MVKDKLLTIKVTGEEKTELKKLAREEGHNSVAGFIMWLIRHYAKRRLKAKK